MKYGLISDIHASLEALEAALEQLRESEAFICLGDLVGYGPNPNECIDAVRELPGLTCIAGNHDLAAVDKYDLNWFNPYARQAIEWTTDRLRAENSEYLRSLPLIRQLPPFTLVHGALPEPMEYVLSDSDARITFHEMNTPACLIGHSHVAEYYRQRFGNEIVDRFPLFSGGKVTLEEGFRHLMNIGSVGQPRDGNPHASFGLWDEQANTITLRRLPYDIEKTQHKMNAAGLPDYLIQRLAQGR